MLPSAHFDWPLTVSRGGYTKAMNQLAARGEQVLVLSHTGADSRFSPGSKERLDLYRNMRSARDLGDHLRPSASGYKAIPVPTVDALARIDGTRKTG